MSPVTNRRARLVVALSALFFYAIFIWRTSFVAFGTRFFVLFEDAMISMRYARNLAEGHGLTWNAGEPPIEGFTNFLWTLWMSVAHCIGLTEPKVSLFIMLTGVAILLANGLVVSKIAQRLSTAPWVPLVALTATLFDYPLVFWTLRGMEVGALTLVIDTLLWLVLLNEEKFSVPRTILMGVLTSAAILLRSDSVIPVGLIGLYGLLTAERRFFFLCTFAVSGGVTAAAQTAFRVQYYHDRLPNTYYLKLFHIPFSARVKRGAFVALQVLTMHLAVPISLVVANVTGVRKDFYKDRDLRRKVLLGALFVAQIGYATYVGGDAWEWMLYANRYSCVGMPALILLCTLLVESLVTQDQPGAPGARRERAVRMMSFALLASGLCLLALEAYAKVRPEAGIAATIVFSKTPAAVGAGLVLIGAILRLKDSREALRDGIEVLARHLASRKTASYAAIALVAIVWLPCHALPLGRWLVQNAAQYKDEARYTRLAILIDKTTPKDLRIAVAAAGATPYFCARPTEDLLGKNDKVIAKLAPRGVFSPGHDKWDYHYSLGERGARLIVELVDQNAQDQAYIESLGFETLRNELRLRKDTPGVDRAALGTPVETPQALEAALADHPTSFPGFGASEVAIVLVFGLLAAFAIKKIAKDDDDYGKLSADPPKPLDDVVPPATTKGEAENHIKTLDGMRGLAVLAVLAFHFAWTFPDETRIAHVMHEFLWSGWVGVDLFFVLSGYLITRGLVADSKKPLGTRMKMFWMRRVLRIFPVYYAVVIVGAIVSLALGMKPPTLPYWIYMQNYALAFDDVVLRWTAHFWSLAIEEQFYFVWPIVALTLPRKRLIPLILGLIVTCVLLRAGITFKGHFWNDQTTKMFVYRATFTRCDGLLLGALVAVLQHEPRLAITKVWRRMRMPILVLTGAMLAGLYAIAGGLNDYDRRVIGVGYFVMALFFAATVSRCADGAISDRMHRFLSWSPLTACGKVSYGMYIFHWPLLVVLVPWLERTQVGMSPPVAIVFSLGVVVLGTTIIYGAAWVSFRFFEQPFLRLKSRFHG